jgi:formylglycine-generating enzyme required for sulfatase activity
MLNIQKIWILAFGLLLAGCVQSETTSVSVTVFRGHDMVLIPAGPFEMGIEQPEALAVCRELFEPYQPEDSQFPACPSFDVWWEGPVHTVVLDEYYIDRYEVTNSQYAVCVEEGTCSPPLLSSSQTRANYYNDPAFADYPVVFITWSAANTFCTWRDSRLPSEAEWEKAARGTDGRLFPWGNDFDGSRLNFCDSNCSEQWANTDFDDGYEDTAPVDSYPEGQSPYGLFNMGGNVEEWVADWIDNEYYSISPSESPTGPESGIYRVLRGGSWRGNGSFARAAFREAREPLDKSLYAGFRCALSP